MPNNADNQPVDSVRSMFASILNDGTHDAGATLAASINEYTSTIGPDADGGPEGLTALILSATPADRMLCIEFVRELKLATRIIETTVVSTAARAQDPGIFTILMAPEDKNRDLGNIEIAPFSKPPRRRKS